MKSINEKVINEIVINKSRFICVLVGVNDKSLVSGIIDDCKRDFKDATHYCYGYIIGSYLKCDDDGEPSGTAGNPILNVLENNELTNVLAVVIRYFGGVKLGAGGLVRAYSKCVSEAINLASISSLVDGFDLEIEFDYDDIKMIDYLLKDISVSKVFDERVKYSFKISLERFLEIENIFINKVKVLKKEAILLCV